MLPLLLALEIRTNLSLLDQNLRKISLRHALHFRALLRGQCKMNCAIYFVAEFTWVLKIDPELQDLAIWNVGPIASLLLSFDYPQESQHRKNLFLVATNTKVLFRNRLIRLLLLPRLSSDISIVLFFFWNEFHSIILITLFRWLWWICWTLSPIKQAKRGPANCVTLLTCWAAQTIYMAIELFCHYTIGSCLDWW